MIVIDQRRSKDREFHYKQKWRQNGVRYVAKENNRIDLDKQYRRQQADGSTVSQVIEHPIAPHFHQSRAGKRRQ